MVLPDFCSAKMAQVHRLAESLLEIYIVRRNIKTTLPETCIVVSNLLSHYCFY